MKGSLVNRNGHYAFIIEEKDSVTGKRRRKWIKAGDDYREAVKLMTKTVNDINNGVYVEPSKTTLAEYLGQWITDYAYPNLSPKVAEGYESIINNHLIPVFGNLLLTQLKPNAIQSYITKKLKEGRKDRKSGGLTARTVRHHIVCLHTALQHALKQGSIARNPVDAVIMPRSSRVEMHTMNEADIHIFLEYARSTIYYPLFYTLLFTGLRRSEALALRWQDVNLLLMQISVNRSLHQLKGSKIVYRNPKTEKSRRLVAMTPSNAVVLREHLKARKQYLKSINPKFDTEKDFDQNELVFCHYNGTPWLPNTISHAWEKLAKRTGLQHIRLHDARHTFASIHLKRGTHPKIVQEMLGHSSIQITLDTYSHVAPGLQEAAAKNFDKLVVGKKKKTNSTVRR